MGGATLLDKTSLYDILVDMYPDYDWLPWKFEKCPNNFWSNKNNVRNYLDWAGKQLNVKEMSDWYNVSFNVKINNKQKFIFSRNFEI